MTSERLEQAKTLYDEFNNHNIPGILDLLDPEIVWTSFGPDFAKAVGVYNGHVGVKQFFTDLMTQQTDTSFVPMQFYAGGATVHAIGQERGYLNPNKLEFVNNWDHTMWFQDGNPKITHFRANYNLALDGRHHQEDPTAPKG